ncbi:MAG: Holliday junction branch migration protein RuvA [Lentisphaeria bacterium]|jgi:Holliday junction DNA helicase RuvA|nr:Holliday junction branch migration protein RuvA [Lentisphaeria bacterium]
MISYLQGALAEKNLTRVVIDVQGIGFEVFIPMSTYDRLPREGDKTMLRTYMHIRDDAMQLYGFASEVERALFVMLISSVSGIGPKIGLNMLSALPAPVLCEAIVREDVKALIRINGVGKRTAERLVVELKDKIGEVAPEIAAGVRLDHGDGEVLQAAEDAINGLVTLGFKIDASRTAVGAVSADLSDGEQTADNLIRAALVTLNK